MRDIVIVAETSYMCRIRMCRIAIMGETSPGSEITICDILIAEDTSYIGRITMCRIVIMTKTSPW